MLGPPPGPRQLVDSRRLLVATWAPPLLRRSLGLRWLLAAAPRRRPGPAAQPRLAGPRASAWCRRPSLSPGPGWTLMLGSELDLQGAVADLQRQWHREHTALS